MTGAEPPENGEITQPMATPPSIRPAGSGHGAEDTAPPGRGLGDTAPGRGAEDTTAPGHGLGDTAAPGRGAGDTAAPGPYADVDTIDEPDAAVLAARAASWPSGGAAPADAASGFAVAPGRPRAAPTQSGAGSAASAARTGPTLPVPAAPSPVPGPPPGSGGSSLAWLWCEQGAAGEYLLTSHSVTVGRASGSDIVLAEPSVSPEHARLYYDGRQWWVLPADSAGPTWVNGQPITPGQRVPVTDGDRLRFGYHTQFRLLVPGARG